MSSIGAAPRAAASLSPARAAASRRNGAQSRGPKTPEGKARSPQNALKHGLRAQKCVVLSSEDAAAFEVVESALIEDLAPEGALQSVLAQRVVAASWRLERAERLEADLFAENRLAGRSLGLALIRDCNGARSFDTLLRYRSGTLAELWRALRTLKALQAEQAARPEPAAVAPRLLPELHEMPIKPEGRANPGEIEPVRAASEPAPPSAAAVPAAKPCQRASARTQVPGEPESRANPRDCPLPPAASEPAPIIEGIGTGSRALAASRNGAGWRPHPQSGCVAADRAPGQAGPQRAPTDAL